MNHNYHMAHCKQEGGNLKRLLTDYTKSTDMVTCNPIEQWQTEVPWGKVSHRQLFHPLPSAGQPLTCISTYVWGRLYSGGNFRSLLMRWSRIDGLSIGWRNKWGILQSNRNFFLFQGDISIYTVHDTFTFWQRFEKYFCHCIRNASFLPAYPRRWLSPVWWKNQCLCSGFLLFPWFLGSGLWIHNPCANKHFLDFPKRMITSIKVTALIKLKEKAVLHLKLTNA